MCLQFGSYEWVEIIDTKIGFCGFGEVFFVIGAAVVGPSFARMQQYFIENSGRFRLIPCSLQFRVAESQDLIMETMSQLVQHNVRMLCPHMAGDQVLCIRNMNMFRQTHIVTIVS